MIRIRRLFEITGAEPGQSGYRSFSWPLSRASCRSLATGLSLLAALASPVAQALDLSSVIMTRGDVVLTGTCANDRSGNETDTDADTGTASSASADLIGVPAGATIKQATLYWHGNASIPGSTMKLKLPGSASYSSYVGTDVGTANGDMFAKKVDLTAALAALPNPNGTYWGADMTGATPWLQCWSLFVIYDLAGQPYRRISTFEGNDAMRANLPGGFTAVLPANTLGGGSVGFFGVDGNLYDETDPINASSLKINGVDVVRQVGCTATSNPPYGANNDFWCGNGGAFNQNLPPSYVNLTGGYTADIEKVPLDVSHLPQGAGSVPVTYVSDSGDEVVLHVLTLSSLYNAPVISVTKTASGAVVAPGSALTFTVVVQNATGAGTASNALFSDALPTGLINAQWTCTAAGATSCPNASGSGAISAQTIASLPAGASLTYTLTATVDPAFTGTITNTADLTPDPADAAFCADTQGNQTPAATTCSAAAQVTASTAAPMPTPTSVPTLNQWALALLGLLMVLASMARTARRG